jgi:hypothetical protein
MPEFPDSGALLPKAQARRPILHSRTGQRIGHVEGVGAFDLSGKLRCRYDENSGNLRDPNTGKVVGYISFAGNFVGSSWVRDELFPANIVAAAEVSPPETCAQPNKNEPQANITETRSDTYEQALESFATMLKAKLSKTEGSVPMPSEREVGQEQDSYRPVEDASSDDPDVERALAMIRETLRTK